MKFIVGVLIGAGLMAAVSEAQQFYGQSPQSMLNEIQQQQTNNQLQQFLQQQQYQQPLLPFGRNPC